jgi:hypothetical protein
VPGTPAPPARPPPGRTDRGSAVLYSELPLTPHHTAMHCTARTSLLTASARRPLSPAQRTSLLATWPGPAHRRPATSLGWRCHVLHCAVLGCTAHWLRADTKAVNIGFSYHLERTHVAPKMLAVPANHSQSLMKMQWKPTFAPPSCSLILFCGPANGS